LFDVATATVKQLIKQRAAGAFEENNFCNKFEIR